jgi:S-adenosylmethionine:tRNA ribosyltransferase-isomerase
LKLSEFDFDLPEDLIAQRPLADRSQARLMVVRRNVSKIEHRKIADLPQLLASGDLLVFNDTRVIPARLLARRRTGGKVEVLLTRPLGEGRFHAMLRNVKGLAVGAELIVGDDTSVFIESVMGGGFFGIRIDSKLATMAALETYGHIPLPPYIRREDDGADRSTYQTMFANEPGSAAAPTAGLHFTEPLLQALSNAGVDNARLTLHVGPGTFLPVREEAEEDITQHKMHSEPFEVSAAAASKIAAAKARRSRVITVGTTSMRTLESVARTHGAVVPTKGETDIFITPGHRFLVADALLTNFHLPRSTLLMLVSAFAGMELVRTAYQAAVNEKYRFFSYGDACLFL